MAFQFDEKFFGEPIPLNIGKALHENNPLRHAFYEVIANALDGGEGKKPSIAFDAPTNTITISNEGREIMPDHFRVGSGRNPHSIHGQHGFGMKDYLATFTRLGCEVDIKSGNLQYSFELKCGPLGEVVFLTVWPRENGNDTIVSIKGPLDLTDLYSECESAKAKFLTFLELTPLSTSDSLDVYCFPVSMSSRDKRDFIFINGARKTVSNYNLSFIYDFKKISESDRKHIGLEHDAKFKRMEIYQNLKGFVLEHRNLSYMHHSLERTWIAAAEKLEPKEESFGVEPIPEPPKRSSAPHIASIASAPPISSCVVIPPPQPEFRTVSNSILSVDLLPDIRNILVTLDRLMEHRQISVLYPLSKYTQKCQQLADRLLGHIRLVDGVERASLVGSLSRNVGLVGTMDIDLLVVKKRSERGGGECAPVDELNVSSLIKGKLLLAEPGAEIYLESEKLIKFVIDTIHVDVVIIDADDTAAIRQFTDPIKIASVYDKKYSSDKSVVVAMKFLLSHVKLLTPENRLKSVILECIVWNEREEMIAEDGWLERNLTADQQVRELFYRCVTFVLSSTSESTIFTKWAQILRNAGVCHEDDECPEAASLLSFNVDCIKSFAKSLCYDKDSYFHHSSRRSYGTKRYNGRVW